ncbi:hypothetical protein ACQKNX_07870 [Lysinibacillus sp. NPDC093712]|uniref:hypothetical protein n=1 Tax=Lysinibacillus sp. NPDC093712 TaxID=3390579 RepID=UPI003D045C35
MKIRIVKTRVLADALVWLGFEYTKDEEDNFIFERTPHFDRAWKDLHYVRSCYSRYNKNKLKVVKYEEN